MEYQVKVWKPLLLTWHKRTLIIKDNIFQIIRDKFGKKKDIINYPLYSAVLLDQSKENDYKILIGTSSYKIFIKPLSKEDKRAIILQFEEKIKRFLSQNSFSEDYVKNNEEILAGLDNSPYGLVMKKLNLFQNLLLEMTQKLNSFKELIQNKHKTETEYMLMHNNLFTIKEEMKNQFDEIISSVYNYHDYIEGVDTSLLSKNNFKIQNNYKNNTNNISSEDEDSNNNISNNNNNNNLNLDSLKEMKIERKESSSSVLSLTDDNSSQSLDNTKPKDPYFFLSNNKEDFHDDLYNFEKRKVLPHKIVCPKNIIKEFITNLTKKLPSPVYFNEPISMGQKQCERFKYIDLLIKAGTETSKEKQMCYIAAFIIGELFLNLGRSLKPFSPIIGETYEYFDNSKNFRFYSEHVQHTPHVNAYIGETPEFAFYGDTMNSTSFKFFKGSVELLFKNKTHVHCKGTGDHYIYNFPSVYVKGLMKPPMYNDYSGTTIIQNTNHASYRCEIKFIEEGWSPNSLGNFEGTVFKDYDTVVYLLKGNWTKEIYITNPDGENRQDLLILDDKQEYLKNNLENYVIPEYTCGLNQLTPELEKILPRNDSRFRQDIRLLEQKVETEEAQSYKSRYEKKQNEKLLKEPHKILYFTEYTSPESECKYYIPNGKYWEERKKGKLNENENNSILDLNGY